MSSDNFGVVNVPISLSIENDFEVDAKGVLQILTLLSHNNDLHDDEFIEYRQGFDDLVDSVIEFYQTDSSNLGAGQLHMMANEFARYVDRLREVAGHLEGRIEPDDLLEIDNDDIPEGYPV